MAKRIFVHVGTPKTGTTYLQSLLWSNKSVLAEQGLLLPSDRVRDHYLLSNIARATEDVLTGMSPRGLSSWDRMLDEVSGWPTDVLISHELFAMVLPDRAEWVIDQLESSPTRSTRSWRPATWPGSFGRSAAVDEAGRTYGLVSSPWSATTTRRSPSGGPRSCPTSYACGARDFRRRTST